MLVLIELISKQYFITEYPPSKNMKIKTLLIGAVGQGKLTHLDKFPNCGMIYKRQKRRCLHGKED